eukprot:6283103-Prorocentrum_lima.AAC.1
MQHMCFPFTNKAPFLKGHPFYANMLPQESAGESSTSAARSGEESRVQAPPQQQVEVQAAPPKQGG